MAEEREKKLTEWKEDMRQREKKKKDRAKALEER